MEHGCALKIQLLLLNLCITNDDKLTKDCNAEIRLTGQAIGRALIKLVGEIVLNLSTCVGQGFDGAASLASERFSATSTFLADAKKAQHNHCVTHRLKVLQKLLTLRKFSMLKI